MWGKARRIEERRLIIEIIVSGKKTRILTPILPSLFARLSLISEQLEQARCKSGENYSV